MYIHPSSRAKSLLAMLIVLTFFSLFMSDEAECEPSGRLIIFHAGSLSVPFAQMEKEFEKRYPRVDVLRESGGSTKMARMISELGKPADIMAAADYLVIQDYLIPEHADWNVQFATNRLVLCYTDRSRHADRIDGSNWYKILALPEVQWGHADPDLDPCGYRSLMVLQLAERHYGVPGLYERLMAGRPERNVRPKSVELIAMLESGHLDYAWEYESVAVQHGLKYISLPDEIDLGNPRFDSFYAQAVVKVAGKEPGALMERRGRSCVYGVTLLKDARNREAALAFLDYLFDPEGGLAVLKANGQQPLVPPRLTRPDMAANVPALLRPRLGLSASP